jgi:regulator of sirC expression with transglutaminase-like and TPR domain
MDVNERFVAALTASPEPVRLDVAAFCIAARAHPGFDVDEGCARLDELARACPAGDFAALRHHLFEVEGFRGNADDYGDPENSFLDSVLERRLGIPITLSVVTIEVGRRIGVEVLGVGMPGHFLVREADGEGVWCDPFHGGQLLELDDCRRLFERVHSSTRGFHPSFLAATPETAVIARMLANLEQSRLASDPVQLGWMCDLHLAIPDLTAHERTRVEALQRSVRARWN